MHQKFASFCILIIFNIIYISDLFLFLYSKIFSNSIIMINTNFKNFMINYLQNEYKRFSNILNKYFEHVERCHNEFIISVNDRNHYLKILNELIRNMNNIYNEKIKILKGKDIIDLDTNDNEDESKNTNIIAVNKNINFYDKDFEKLLTCDNYNNELLKLIDVYESFNINNLYGIELNNFNDIKIKLLQMSNNIGFFNINNALNLIIGQNYSNIFDPNLDGDFINKLEILSKYFVPLSFTKKKSDNIQLDIICSIKITNHEILLDNYYEINLIIPYRKLNIIFCGYFINDPINIIVRTSQICRQFLYNKKKNITEHINKSKFINEKFKNMYIKNLTIGEIMAYDLHKISEKIDNDYTKYIKLSKLSFKNLMQEFLNDNSTIKIQFNIIKLFLIGNTEENINMAGLLFGLTKDKKFGNDFLSNIIYKNLNYISQTKLRKSSVTIKTELDKLKNMSTDDVDLKKQIALCKNMPNYVKKIAVDKVEEMKSGSSEYYKQKTYLDILLNYPWPCPNDDDIDLFKNIGSDLDESKKFLDKLKMSLDDKVYGHNECKSVMQELIGKWLTNPKSSGKVIGLAGPPGVGKTMIAKALGDALCIPFTQINLGGMEDRCILSGHSYTYSAAQPGLILRKMVEAGKPRCIIYFDELDKACTKHGINEIYNVLIHVTDPNTNSQFSDAFFNEVTFRLDKVLFVFSYNDAEKIDKILLDRMEKIDVKPYTTADKLIILKNFLIKEVSEGIGVNHDYVHIEDNDIEYIIDNYTFEAGVRELKRKLETIFLKLNLDRIFRRGIFENNIPSKITINKEHIDKYLNKPNLNIKQIHKSNEIGIINGLYATNSGSGGIIPILIYNNFIGTKNKFILKITGSQGKVMKESVSFAFTTAMNLLKQEYRQEFLNNYPYGLHIHTPDGATPKDGPSAGSAFTTAFISRILNKKIKNDIAMTGEIEMNGNITAIGGLEYKLKGAQKAGVKIVFVPNENKDDLAKIFLKDKFLEKELKIHLVSHISEILRIALVDDIPYKKISRSKKQLNDMLFDPEKYLNITFK